MPEITYHKQYYEENKEKIEEYRRNWNKNNKEKKLEYNRKWRKNNPKKALQQQIRKYCLSYIEWEIMWEAQDGKCAICGRNFKTIFSACVDHNHITGQIRGLLCRSCNYGIGNFKDNPVLLIEASKYLIK